MGTLTGCETTGSSDPGSAPSTNKVAELEAMLAIAKADLKAEEKKLTALMLHKSGSSIGSKIADMSGVDLSGNVHEQLIISSESVKVLQDAAKAQEKALATEKAKGNLPAEKAPTKDKGDGFGGGGGGGC